MMKNMTSVIFIDSAVNNYETLLQGVVSNIQTYVIQPEQDGVAQITQILSQHCGVESVHIVSHGAPGRVYLGNSELSYETLNHYAEQLINWTDALSANAQLLLYGCEVAQTEVGREFVHRLSEMTGAVVAASDDRTGNATLGGDWELEVSTGNLTEKLAFLPATLAAYDAVLAVPSLVKNINPTGGSSPAELININGTLYFVANDGTNGLELWKSDRTTAGTVLLKDINTTAGSGSSPAELLNINSTLYFVANDGTNGLELWKSDGTAAGTILLKDINTTAGSGSSATELTNVNNTLYFVANDGTNGLELWKSDGTAAGTVLVKDINIILGSGSSVAELTDVNGTLYFVADNAANGLELWKSDGTAAGTMMVADINMTGGSSAAELTDVNGTLYFVADDGTNGKELWKSDGTAAGTMMVKDINTTGSSSAAELTDVNGILYFVADNGTNGKELWKSDGTAAGTMMVKDINTTGSSSAAELTDVNGTLYFVADDGNGGLELWKSDGTTAGTVLVKDINPMGGSSPTELTNINGTLYFVADNGTNGKELWKSDGTAAGTMMVTDINMTGSSSPSDLTDVNGTLYFFADDGTNGKELWTLPPNQAPTDLTLSATKVDENVVAGTVIGTFNTTDPDQDTKHIYTLVSGTGDTDNSAFIIEGNSLKIKASPDFETKSAYKIRVRTTDPGGLFYDKQLTVDVNDLNDTIPIQTTVTTSFFVKISEDSLSIKSKVKADKVKISIKVKEHKFKNACEIGVYTVDDAEGRINGIAPGAAGYIEAALERAKVLFSSIANSPNGFSTTDLTNLLQFNSNANLKFFLVRNSSIEAVLTKKTAITDVLFSSSENFQLETSEDEGFFLKWKGSFNSTSSEFEQLTLKINTTDQDLPLGTDLQGKPECELIDLRQVSVSTKVKAEFFVNREAAFNNFVGFYQISDDKGGIDTNGDGTIDLRPGDAGYIQAAVKGRIAGIDLKVNNQAAANFSSSFQGGLLFAPFIIVNGTPDDMSDDDDDDDTSGDDLKVYFPFLNGNSDKVDHIRLLGSNIFGFEDQAGGGDRDFNDLIVKASLSIQTNVTVA
jgi:trimeric autotransporter adhesin